MPFGAVPLSPFGDTPGPKGTPLGATAAVLAVVAIADGDATGDPLGLTFGPRGTPFGAVPLSPLGDTPGPRTTPLGATAAGLAVVAIAAGDATGDPLGLT